MAGAAQWRHISSRSLETPQIYSPPNERKKIAQTLLLGRMTRLFSVCSCFGNAKVKVIRAL